MLPDKFHETLETILYIALNSGAKPVSSRDLCTYQNVAPRHLELILQNLVKHGILRGAKGPKGGYSLAKERRRITMLDILQACQKNHPRDHHSPLYTAIIQPFISETESTLTKQLAPLTLDDLCQTANQIIAADEKSDFMI